MKILFLIPTLGNGGAEKTLLQLVNNYSIAGCDNSEIHVKCLFNKGNLINKLNDNVKFSFVFKHCFRGNIYFLKLFSPKFLFKRFIKEKYDIIVPFLEGPTTRIISGCNYDAKLLNWVHTSSNSVSVLAKSYRSKKELQKCYIKYDKTVFVAETAQKTFLAQFPELADISCSVVYNPINTEEVIENSNESCEILFDKTEFNIVSVGRMEKVKSFDRLIDVVSKLNKELDKRIHLYLIGDGSQREVLKNKVKDLKCEKFITFMGFKPNPYKYVKQSDLYVCSSLREGYSTSVIEALVLGIPVVTTDCSGMTEILGHNQEYGLITKNDEESLFEGIKSLLTDNTLYQKYKKSAEVRGKDFSLKDNIAKFKKVIE